MTVWTWCWVAWLAWFLVVEGLALFNHTEGDTLSEHVWKWFHVMDRRPTPLVVAGRIVLGLFLVWLLGHLTFGWWTPTHPWP